MIPITIDEARKLDEIMSTFEGDGSILTTEPNERELCLRLRNLGYVNILSEKDPQGKVQITDSGLGLVRKGGFVKQLEDEILEKNYKNKGIRQAKIANWIAAIALLVAMAAFFREELFTLFK